MQSIKMHLNFSSKYCTVNETFPSHVQKKNTSTRSSNLNFPRKVLTRSPASLLWRFISIRPSSLDPLRWFLSLSRVSTKYLANLYPYSILSPHPPQIQSRAMSLGRPALLHPHLLSSPSRHDRLTEWMTPAEDTAWVKAASLLAAKTKNPGNYKLLKLRLVIVTLEIVSIL